MLDIFEYLAQNNDLMGHIMLFSRMYIHAMYANRIQGASIENECKKSNFSEILLV